jgi:hypothetical protein
VEVRYPRGKGSEPKAEGCAWDGGVVEAGRRCGGLDEPEADEEAAGGLRV